MLILQILFHARNQWSFRFLIWLFLEDPENFLFCNHFIVNYMKSVALNCKYFESLQNDIYAQCEIVCLVFPKSFGLANFRVFRLFLFFFPTFLLTKVKYLVILLRTFWTLWNCRPNSWIYDPLEKPILSIS